MRPTVRHKWASGRAKASIDQRRASHFKFVTGVDFKKRTHGSERLGERDPRIGKPFPIYGQSKKLPKPRFGKRTRMKVHMTPLEIDAMKYEKALEESGFEGYTIALKFKDGDVKEFPLIAENWHQAFRVAHNFMQKYNAEDIDEIVICDPSLSEIAHAISGGAHRFAGAIKRGVEKIPGYAQRGLKFAKRVEARGLRAARRVKKEAIESARLAGRIVAMPSEITEVYRAGVTERPGAALEAEEPEYGKSNIIRERLKEAKAAEELQKIEERKRLLRRTY
jgi:hypothetical protein